MNETERKAAAFDWLCAQIQESCDCRASINTGDMSIRAYMACGYSERCGVHAEIEWRDPRDEPLNLLAAIEKAMGGE